MLNGIWDTVCSWAATGVGFTIASTGIVVRELAAIVVMVGILCWMCRCTKVFRWGSVGYLLGLILELIGSVMM